MIKFKLPHVFYGENVFFMATFYCQKCLNEERQYNPAISNCIPFSLVSRMSLKSIIHYWPSLLRHTRLYLELSLFSPGIN